MSRQAQIFRNNAIPEEYADEVLRVGMLPALPNTDKTITIGRYAARLTEEVTRDEFLERVEAAGLPRSEFEQCPENLRFFRFMLLHTD